MDAHRALARSSRTSIRVSRVWHISGTCMHMPYTVLVGRFRAPLSCFSLSLLVQRTTRGEDVDQLIDVERDVDVREPRKEGERGAYMVYTQIRVSSYTG